VATLVLTIVNGLAQATFPLGFKSSSTPLSTATSAASSSASS